MNRDDLEVLKHNIEFELREFSPDEEHWSPDEEDWGSDLLGLLDAYYVACGREEFRRILQAMLETVERKLAQSTLAMTEPQR